MAKNDYSYGWEKLHCAVLALVGQGNQKDRLFSAMLSLHNLHILQNPENHLPNEIKDEYIALCKEMVSIKAIGDEGDIRATIDTLDEMKIRNITQKIVGFYDTICRHKKP